MMLGKLTSLLRRRATGTDAERMRCWELVAEAEDTLIIRPLSPRLSAEQLRKMLDDVQSADPSVFRRVRIDLSHVIEFPGQWGVHFALLIRFASEVPGRVHVTGVHGRLAAMAWLLRRSPEVRWLLFEGGDGGPRPFGRARDGEVA